MTFQKTAICCIRCGDVGAYRDDASTTDQYYCRSCGTAFRAHLQELDEHHTKRLRAMLVETKASMFVTYVSYRSRVVKNSDGKSIIESKEYRFTPRDILFPNKSACDNCKHHTVPEGFVHVVCCMKHNKIVRSKDRCDNHEPQRIQTD